MRLVFTADLHGNRDKYKQALDLTVTHAAQALIVGGDLLPHTIKISNAIAIQRDFVTTHLRPLFQQFRANHPDKAIYLLAGNDDWAAAMSAINDLETDTLAYPLHQRVYQLSPALWLAGYGCVPVSPFSIKDYERLDDDIGKQPLPTYSFSMAYTSFNGQPEHTSLAKMISKPSIASDLAVLARQSDPTHTIYVCHAPPYDTLLDRAHAGHRGSRTIRTFIEQHHPPLTLHGHIHESPQLTSYYMQQLGNTWCINPGQDERVLHAVTLDTDDVVATIQHTVPF